MSYTHREEQNWEILKSPPPPTPTPHAQFLLYSHSLRKGYQIIQFYFKWWREQNSISDISQYKYNVKINTSSQKKIKNSILKIVIVPVFNYYYLFIFLERMVCYLVQNVIESNFTV